MAGGGTGQRRGEAAGISRAVRVFKRYLKTGDTAPLWVSEGGLEHGFRCDLPGSGKSCNKSNTTGADAPGHSAACSLSRPLPGLHMAVRQVRASAPAPVTVAPSGTDSWLRGQGRADFRVKLGDARARHRSAGEHLRRGRQPRADRVVSAHDTNHFRSCRIECVASSHTYALAYVG